MSLPNCEHDLAYKHPLIGGESYCCACLRKTAAEMLEVLGGIVNVLTLDGDCDGKSKVCPSCVAIAAARKVIAKAEALR